MKNIKLINPENAIHILNEKGLTTKSDQLTVFNEGRDLLILNNKEFSEYSQGEYLKIGFGGGDSLKLWNEYFDQAEIYCIDNNLSRIQEYNYTPEKGINIFYGDQSDSLSLIESCKQMGVTQFDIIIDDGSHVDSHIMTTFHTLFDQYLAPGGIYFVEDYLDTLTYSSENIQSLDYKNELTTIIKK